MKVILLENVLLKGQRHKAGESLDLCAEMAEGLERAGVALIETAPKTAPTVAPEAPNFSRPKRVAPNTAGSALELPSDARKATPAGRKASTLKKGARGKK